VTNFPTEAAGGEYDVEHLPPWGSTALRTQLTGVKVPPAPPSSQMMIPVGFEGVALRSETVAVSVIAFPTDATAELGETVVLVTEGGGGGGGDGGGSAKPTAPDWRANALVALAAKTSTKTARKRMVAVRSCPAPRFRAVPVRSAQPRSHRGWRGLRRDARK
jgi:hypothetical protein